MLGRCAGMRPDADARRLLGRDTAFLPRPVGADNAVTSRDLGILLDQAAEPVASPDAHVVAGGREMGLAVGWLLAEGSVRPVGVVVIDVLAERVVQMSPAGDEDAVGALAPRGGDPPLADRVRPRRPGPCRMPPGRRWHVCRVRGSADHGAEPAR